MGLFDKLAKKQLDKYMESGLKRSEELMNLDRSDPEAIRHYLEKTRPEFDAKLPEWLKNSASPLKNSVSSEQLERIANLQQQAINQQAEVYRKPQDKDKKE